MEWHERAVPPQSSGSGGDAGPPWTRTPSTCSGRPWSGRGRSASERLAGYLTKAIREAKRRTSWTDSDPGYEAAVLGLGSPGCSSDASLRGSIEAFVAAIAADALANSLGAKLVQLTMPGVPDVYQGCELTGLSLVDPDNRRPVDYARRQSLLADLDAGRLDAASSPDPTAIPWRGWTRRSCSSRPGALRLRRDHPDWFAGSYEPLTAVGRRGRSRGGVRTRRARRHGGHPAARRSPPAGRLGRHATATACSRAAAGWVDVLTGAVYRGQSVLLADLTQRLPVALLVPLVPEGE